MKSERIDYWVKDGEKRVRMNTPFYREITSENYLDLFPKPDTHSYIFLFWHSLAFERPETAFIGGTRHKDLLPAVLEKMGWQNEEIGWGQVWNTKRKVVELMLNEGYPLGRLKFLALSKGILARIHSDVLADEVTFSVWGQPRLDIDTRTGKHCEYKEGLLW